MAELVESEDLTGFPGAPFPAAVVSAAGAAVQDLAGWHIAPEVTETIEVETYGAVIALLPSLRVVDVTEVRDVVTGEVVEGWRVSKSTGVLRRTSGCWPDVVEVDLTHGYAECPPALLWVVAERAQRGRAGLVRQENVGARSISYAKDYDSTGSSVLARYTLQPRP